MARPLPKQPDPEVAIVDAGAKVTRDWRTFFIELVRRVPATGTVTFASATTAAVTFAISETDANYNIHFDAPEDRRAWATSKTTTGFTANVSASSSATYGWTLQRR